jgi:hypothetical protein
MAGMYMKKLSLLSIVDLIIFHSYRYIDDVFMTTNSLDQIQVQLNRAEKKDKNIQITRSLGTTVEFLDVLVTNDHEQLKTSVFHKPAAEPYILPYLSEHPRHIHRNTIKGALFRAARLCSNVQDFDNERLHIEMTLLLNGYPLTFVTYHFKRFFQQHNATLLFEQLDDPTYQILHKNLLLQPSRRERRQQNNETLKAQQNSESKNSDRPTITVHFTYESGPMLQFKQELRRLWEKYYIYPGSQMNDVSLQIGTRTNQSLCQLFVKKKPSKNMLKNVTLAADTTNTNNTTN